ncbi:FecR family protein [Pedobacter psychrodurus]|uniref:FecR family protein n=1 Tax=Pedobacter psychrodurus TaxID=2530456 RepID=UPI0029310E5B|nr:FecR family protein [Pedobacter psychrodurus]
MSTTKAKELLEKYRSGMLSPEEMAILDTWYLRTAAQEDLIIEEAGFEDNLDRVWDRLSVNHSQPVKRKLLSFPRLAAAAILLVLCSFGLYFYLNRTKVDNQIASSDKHFKNDIRPGGNRALLTLGDGSEIVLDDASNGQLAIQSGVRITKTAEGRLLYSVADTHSSGLPTFNTISTPKGGAYQIELPDGTRVWLNAGSSLKFPANFPSSERKVDLQGEAYFEVAKNALKPFKVECNRQEITVLGTHFNVNAYANEKQIKTTLFEGAVRLNAKGAVSRALKPGEEAAFSSGKFLISRTNGEESIAWKKGIFQFEDADIATIMRQLERWYNVEVEYRGNISEDTFRGKISRNVNLSQVLEILEVGGVKFDIEGKKIIVN